MAKSTCLHNYYAFLKPRQLAEVFKSHHYLTFVGLSPSIQGLEDRSPYCWNW